MAEKKSKPAGGQTPVFLARIPAGFPSPGDDYVEKSLDLNEHLISHPAATFLVRVDGNSMADANIHPGDLLVIDRSLEARHNNIVAVVLNGEITVKRLLVEKGRMRLAPENPAYPTLEVTPEMDCEVWGVVTYIIHRAR